MEVIVSVGVQVMVAVFGGPPEDALLSGRLRQKCQRKLEAATSTVGSVREISMITRSDRENAKPV